MADNTRRPKLLEADRNQFRMLPMDLDRLVAPDDPVRAVWAFVDRLDLSVFHEQIKSTEGQVGRPAIDPRILLALWMQATLDGIGSAREIERLASNHVRYMWICGGVVPNYHTLSDFRSNSMVGLEQLLCETIAVLLHKDLVDLQRVAHDGMRVRASAGAASFRSGKTLKELKKITREQLETLRSEMDADAGAGSRRSRAAQERAARERDERIERALAELPEAQERKESNNGKKKSEARVSSTDPDARVMKMADGGFRPAMNVQFVTDTTSKVIVAVDITNAGTDHGTMVPLIKDIEQKLKLTPKEWLADGGCITLGNIDEMYEKGCKVIGPVRAPRAPEKDRYEVRPGDSSAVADWRRRMSTEATRAIYRLRGATAELVNAHVRGRGLQQFLVRGLQKVKSVALLHAITHNFMREIALS